MLNPFLQEEITFEPVEHKYYDKDKNVLISVSQLLHVYTKKFDEYGNIIKKCAAKEGISVAELRQRWDDKRDRSCEFGTAVHAEIEYFINNKKIRKSPHKEIVENFKDKIAPLFKHDVFSEVLVYNKDLKIAGLSDLVEFNPENNEISIFDIKTNESLYKKSYNKLLYPLDNLDDNAINKYSIQLSMYGYLLELRGFAINKDNFKIFWVNKEKNIEIIPIQYMKKEVIKMINHYIFSQSFEDIATEDFFV